MTLCTSGTLRCRLHRTRSSWSVLRLMSGSWYQLTPISAALLSRSHATGPSVLLIRRLAGRRAAEQSAIILANLDQIAEDLVVGAVVVVGDDWIRIRRLPMPG